MIEHPLLPTISDLTLEQIQNKLSDLNKRLTFAYRRQDPHLINQIQMLLNSYNNAYQTKLTEMLPPDNNFDDKIHIS